MKRFATSVAVLLSLLVTCSAQASITVGQLAPSGFTPATCGPSSGAYVQPTVTSGNSFVIPAAGRIKSWSTRATSATDQQMALRVFRPLGGDVYLQVTHDGPRPLNPSAVNTFPVDLAVKAGDILGVDTFNTGNLVGCAFQVPGETRWGSFPEEPDDGEQAQFFSSPNYRLNISAEFDPSNEFSFAGTQRNKKKGKATITVSLAGPGTAALSGKGLKGQQGTLGAADGGSLTLKVIAKGKAAKKLGATGVAKVTPTVTFTPTGGSPAAKSQKLKLIKRG